MKQNKEQQETKYLEINYNTVTLIDGTADLCAGVESEYRVANGMAIGLALEGTARVQVANDTVSFKPFDIFGLTPGQSFSIQKLSPDFRFKLLFVPATMVSRMRAEVDQSFIYSMLCNEPCHLPARVVEEMQPILERLRYYAESEDGVHHLVNAVDKLDIVFALIDTLVVMANTAAPRQRTESARMSRSEVLARHFFANMLTHHKDNHTVEYYAELQGISPKYLSSSVREATGRSPQEWLTLIVVYAAKRMLLSKDLSIAEVSEKLHFSSAFIRFFRNNAGITPMAYRK